MILAPSTMSVARISDVQTPGHGARSSAFVSRPSADQTFIRVIVAAIAESAVPGGTKLSSWPWGSVLCSLMIMVMMANF